MKKISEMADFQVQLADVLLLVLELDIPASFTTSHTVVIPAFFFRKKWYINFVSKSVRRPSVRPSVRTSVRHVSCKCISS